MAQATETATEKKPIVPFLAIDDGEPYLKGTKCKQCGAYYLGARMACSVPSIRPPPILSMQRAIRRSPGCPLVAPGMKGLPRVRVLRRRSLKNAPGIGRWTR